MTVDDLELL